MVEVIWTVGAQTQVQHTFAKLDAQRPALAAAWLKDLGSRTALLEKFPELAPFWDHPYRRLLLSRELGLFYVIHGRRIAVIGIYPLSMSPERIRARLEQTDWP